MIENNNLKTSWASILLGIVCIFMGMFMVTGGIDAYETGRIIPMTTKSGPMTGLQSIITGILATTSGVGFLGIEVFKSYKRSKQNNGANR